MRQYTLERIEHCASRIDPKSEACYDDMYAEASAMLRAYAATLRQAARVDDWTDAQCLRFMGVALRNVELVDERGPSCDDIRQGVRAALEAALSAQPAPREHHWDRDGERCIVCGDKDWMGGPCNGPRESAQPAQHPDDAAVDRFAAAMKEKLAAARTKGRGGWQDKHDCPQQRLSDMLRDHVEKGDPRDVANFCMFLHERGEAILPAADADSATLRLLIAELRSRESKGRGIYGAYVDRCDLGNSQWRQHLREELMDALLYSLAEERTHPAAPVGVPDGWKLVPLGLTPEMAAAASVAVWPVASAEDREKARAAALIVLKTTMDLMPGATLDSLAAGIATMFPAYRAFLAAAPSAPQGVDRG